MEFQFNRRPRSSRAWVVFVPGGACVLLGVLILAMPQLLVLLVSVSLILMGSILLSLAWRVRGAGARQMMGMFRNPFQG